ACTVDRRVRLSLSRSSCSPPVARREARASATWLLDLTSVRSPWLLRSTANESRLARYITHPTVSLGRAPNGHVERRLEATPARLLGQPRARGSCGGSGVFLSRRDLCRNGQGPTTA